MNEERLEKLREFSRRLEDAWMANGPGCVMEFPPFPRLEVVHLREGKKAGVLVDGVLIGACASPEEWVDARVPRFENLDDLMDSVRLLAEERRGYVEESRLFRPGEPWRWASLAMSPRIPLRSRYADRLVAGAPERYDAIELQGVRVYDVAQTGHGAEILVEPALEGEAPHFYSVYLHLRPDGEEGGVECVGDFLHLEEAAEYARELSERYGYPVAAGRDLMTPPSQEGAMEMLEYGGLCP